MGKRKFTRDFKLSVISELNGKTRAEVCREHDIGDSLLSKWKREYQENPQKAFSGCGTLWKTEAEIERYKRLVGQLYAENEFLKKTLEKLQQLKAEEEKMRRIQ